MTSRSCPRPTIACGRSTRSTAIITSSRPRAAMVERFFAAGRGAGDLGASPEFRLARSALPLSRDDTVFAYFSSAFFRGLLSPGYQIELERRLQAVAQIELLQMAQLAAAAEGLAGREIPDLVAAGLLPGGFGQQPDGSGPQLGAREVTDSLRVRGDDSCLWPMSLWKGPRRPRLRGMRSERRPSRTIGGSSTP